ncbi:hypothetical protein [Actinomycetospora sp. NBRC 106378]|uniref:hypothetical protein n=1 Tax=Actinomycetospora sp. NBRC 106378 TaxID=3032208 RepID=UPI0024A1A2F4|nr:hypothetical protein [Actinomycetospora sp. NBRC 106378]GLZ51890.1 hypothetical protein Acsp07_15070 [Actinomycetospora sp. NBRC 106378]
MSIGISGFACAVGEDVEKPESVPGFAERWSELMPSTDFAAMGAGTFRRFRRPVLAYVLDCIADVLERTGTEPAEVDRLVLATSDPCLARLDPDLAAAVLLGAGLRSCVPALVSHLQCCSSLDALARAVGMFDDPDVGTVVLVALDFTPDDLARVRSFAVFGDAAAGCLLHRGAPGTVELVAQATAVDPEGLRGQDSFRSRQQAARAALARALRPAGVEPGEVAVVLPSNLFAPLVGVNALAVGLPRDRLHFRTIMERDGHCGNADWLLNLIDRESGEGWEPGSVLLAQSSAPGFSAYATLRAGTRTPRDGGTP